MDMSGLDVHTPKASPVWKRVAYIHLWVMYNSILYTIS